MEFPVSCTEADDVILGTSLSLDLILLSETLVTVVEECSEVVDELELILARFVNVL